MIISGCKTLIIKCHICGRLKDYNFNLFQVMNRDRIEYKCECGEVNIIFKGQYNGVNALVNCFHCNEKHYFHFDLHILLRNSISKYCPYGERIVFLGNREENEPLGQESIANKKKEYREVAEEYFKDFKILSKVLIILHNLKKEGKIGCSCGNNKINARVFSDRIELECLKCNGVKLIFAETEEDLSILLKKDRIILVENSISCIDSIMERNKDIKE